MLYDALQSGYEKSNQRSKMTRHKKLKMTEPKDKGLDNREKAEMILMAFFCVLLGAVILSFFIAAIEVVGGYVK